MKRYFVTTILTEKLIAKHKLSFAACNFSFNLVSGGGFSKVFSILPLYVSGKIENDAFNDPRFELIYDDSLRAIGGRWTIFAACLEQWRIFKSISKGSSVWIYNLNTLNALLVLLLKWFKSSVRVYVIVLDFTPVAKGLGLNTFYLKLINSVHGAISLANSELFTCKNRITLPGVVPDDAGSEPLIEVTNKKFLLSGALNETISQTSMVLRAFSELSQCELHITGTIDDDSVICEYAEKYPNIIYHGSVAFSEYLDIMHGVTFLLSTRNPEALENKCNFPSKIIESLLHNRVVVSTIDYMQLKGLKYFKVESNVNTFRQQIVDIIHMDETSLLQYANQGKRMVELFNPRVWNDAMSHIENSK